MEYISSDTNVWLDFAAIDRIEYPFRLPYIYLMNSDAVHDEILSPPELGEKLKTFGLQETELTDEEFFCAGEYVDRFSRLSIFDCIALAIAKERGIALLTGDGALRKAAVAEGIPVMGTIGILDQLYEKELILKGEYIFCLKELLYYNGGKIRLPESELKSRIETVTRGCINAEDYDH